jgi:hypothetical protein
MDVKLRRQADGYYAFNSALNWSDIRKASTNRADPLTAGQLLAYITTMREDLYLSAQFATSIAQDSLGARLTRAKCADLNAALEAQQIKIAKFAEIIVREVTDIRQAVNSGSCKFQDFLSLLEDAEPLRQQRIWARACRGPYRFRVRHPVRFEWRGVAEAPPFGAFPS